MTDLLRLNLNTIKSIHFKCTISMFRVVQPSSQCNFRAFLSPQQETLCPFGDTPLCQPHTQATTNLLSVPLNLPFLGISCKWDNKMWVLCYGFFHLAWYFKTDLCCSICFSIIPIELPWIFCWKSVDQPVIGLWRLCIQLLFSLLSCVWLLWPHGV